MHQSHPSPQLVSDTHGPSSEVGEPQDEVQHQPDPNRQCQAEVQRLTKKMKKWQAKLIQTQRRCLELLESQPDRQLQPESPPIPELQLQSQVQSLPEMQRQAELQCRSGSQGQLEMQGRTQARHQA